ILGKCAVDVESTARFSKRLLYSFNRGCRIALTVASHALGWLIQRKWSVRMLRGWRDGLRV
ncbi:MAG: hypothetical protein VYC98_09865, partial [Planctomycetota bacterium]|nr:hypothetical protein [Planctomycetota bacterium]